MEMTDKLSGYVPGIFAKKAVVMTGLSIRLQLWMSDFLSFRVLWVFYLLLSCSLTAFLPSDLYAGEV
jgi:hypothetical protein